MSVRSPTAWFFFFLLCCFVLGFFFYSTGRCVAGRRWHLSQHSCNIFCGLRGKKKKINKTILQRSKKTLIRSDSRKLCSMTKSPPNIFFQLACKCDKGQEELLWALNVLVSVLCSALEGRRRLVLKWLRLSQSICQSSVLSPACDRVGKPRTLKCQRNLKTSQ